MKKITKSEAAAAMGRVKSPAKTEAARSNGAKGGRPRQDVILARCYETTRGGQVEVALVRTIRGHHLFTINGHVEDARKIVHDDAAREFYEAAPYKEGPRP